MPRSKFDILGIGVVAVAALTVALWAVQQPPRKEKNPPAARQNFDQLIQANAQRMLDEGKRWS